MNPVSQQALKYRVGPPASGFMRAFGYYRYLFLYPLSADPLRAPHRFN